MIGILLNDRAYEQDIRELLMAFYPGEAFVHEEREDLLFTVKGELSPDGSRFKLAVTSGTGGGIRRLYPRLLPGAVMRELDQLGEPLAVNYEDRFETKNKIKRRLYAHLLEQTGRELPWGTLTGIRPVKIATAKLLEGSSEKDLSAYISRTYFTGTEKIALSVEIARNERKLLSAVDYKSGYSLYIGIPFCPTTCLYCSFTSFPISRWQGKTHLYLNALFREMEYVAAKKRDSRPDTVYLGGGTPTSLSAEDLDLLLAKLRTTFQLSAETEFTVEAGRPDSITRKKLQVLAAHGVTRISINPQTMKQETLDLIGRRHTVRMVEDCFHLARELGFDNINMDLIIGLPNETLGDVRSTMDAVRELGPDSLTVHSLAVKRAARLNARKEVYQELISGDMEAKLELAARYARGMGMIPYYLYRQKNMAGNFENVGYALSGKACLYNILMMEEKQTIAACGAGTTTKVFFPEENRLERAENVKDVEQYISRIDEMMKRKELLL